MRALLILIPEKKVLQYNLESVGVDCKRQKLDKEQPRAQQCVN